MSTKYLIHYHGKYDFVTMESSDKSDYYGLVQSEFAKAAGAKQAADVPLWDREWASMERLQDSETAEGVHFTWGLAGPDGAWFNLFQFPDVTEERLKKAKSYLRSERDVVRLSVTKLRKKIEFAMPARPVRA